MTTGSEQRPSARDDRGGAAGGGAGGSGSPRRSGKAQPARGQGTQGQGGKPKQGQGAKPKQGQGGKPTQGQGGKPKQGQGAKPTQGQGRKPKQGQGGKPKQGRGRHDPHRRDHPDETVAQLAGPVQKVLGRLPETQRRVLELRMGLADGHPHDLADTARELGLSLGGAREIEKRAFEHIREAIPLQQLQRLLAR
jgi:hypothetical protein